MESPLALNDLLYRPDIWRGHRAESVGEVRDTGFANLNQALVGGGWPLKGLVEISYSQLGSGEWQLLSGTLENFSDHPGYLVLVNPPAMLCASALAQMGVPLDQVLIIRSASRNDLLAAVLESLKSGCAQMLLFWEGKYSLSYTELRKVQLASTGSEALCMMMRIGQRRPAHSPAVLRLALQSAMTGLQLNIERQRGGLGDLQVELPWPAGWTLQPVDAVSINHQQQGTAGKVLPFQAQS
jgi:protein ImuA